jgi:hypothetical protein
MTVNVTGSGSGSSEPVTALSITPSTDSVALAGQTGQFNAFGTSGSTGLPTNVTTLVAWSSSNVSVATIGATTGLATAVGQGTTQITALYTNPDKSVAEASATFVVTGSASEPLQSIAITPATQSILAGQTSQLIAIGTFSPTAPTPGTQNLTATVAWTSSNTSIASVTNPGGLVIAVGPGTAVITAIAANPDKSVVTATATVTVTGGSSSSEPYVSLAIIPAAQTLTSAAQIAKYIAIGTTSSGTTVDLTSQTNTIWSASSPQVTMPYIPSGQTTAVPGEFTTVGNGAAAITATYTITPATATSPAIVVSGSAALTVAVTATPEPLLSTTIYPISPSVASPGLTSQVVDIGTFSNVPITQDVTKGITNLDGIANQNITTNWSSSTPTVATVTTVCPIGLSALSCTISACPDTSNAGVCTSCPGSTVASGAFCATLNPTSPVGLVTGVSQGTATIMAIATNPDGALVPATASFSVLGGSAETFTALTIYPSSQAATAPAQQSQFLVLGIQGTTGLTYDVTGLVQWCSSNAAVATIESAVAGSATCSNVVGSSPGIATAKASGSTAFTATYTNPDNSQVIATANYNVTIGQAQEPLIAINVIPGDITVWNKGQSAQYLAFGTYSTTPTLRDLTDKVTWFSSTPELATIESSGVSGETGGVATAMGYTGTSVIYAFDSNPDGTIVTSNSVSFTCKDPNTSVCDQFPAPVLLATTTVYNTGSIYNTGENQTTWLVTAPDDQGKPNLIHCGPGSENAGLGNSVCTGTYAVGSNTTLTAWLTSPAQPGVLIPVDDTFGGWSANCNTTITGTAFTVSSVTFGTNTATIVAANSMSAGNVGVFVGLTGNAAVLNGLEFTVTAANPLSFQIEYSAATPGGPYATGGTFTTLVSTPDFSSTCSFAVDTNTSVGAIFYSLSLSCSPKTSGTVGSAFTSGAITVSNGTSPYTFSVVAPGATPPNTLPAGLTLNTSTGAVTGTPTAAGSFSLSATDANGTTASTASACAITIAQ